MTHQEINKTAYQLIRKHQFSTASWYKEEVRKLDARGYYTKIDSAIAEILKKQLIRRSKTLSLAEQCKNNVEKKLSEKLENIYPLKIAEGRWAGGNNNFNVILDTACTSPKFSVNSYREYSSNGKWSGNSCSFRLTIAPSMNFSLIGGLLTVKKKNSNTVWWFQQSRGFEVKLIEGYLYKNYHEKRRKNDTYEKAIPRIQKKRNQAALELKKKRMLNKPLASLDLKRLWVKTEDSIKAGNCPAGTYNFVSKLKKEVGEIGGIRADYLLELSEKFNSKSFVERTIKYAFLQS